MEKKNNTNALFNIGYGLYVITTNDGVRDNGMIANTVCQLTSNPIRIAVTLNKGSYTHDVVKNTGILNVNCISTDAPFKVFEVFGFQSGRDVNKFENCQPHRSANGLVYLPRYINAFMSLEVLDSIDFGTHTSFICSLGECDVVSDKESMTYSYYHKNVKPKPAAEKKKGWICTVCGYVHDEEEIDDDFVCPLCNHGREVFEPLS